jgi:septal ring factor EnvC (AmiA/AmiB activator)
MNQPDPRKHLVISLAKSVLRIMGGIVLFAGMLKSAGVLLILAEVGGILEELV